MRHLNSFNSSQERKQIENNFSCKGLSELDSFSKDGQFDVLPFCQHVERSSGSCGIYTNGSGLGVSSEAIHFSDFCWLFEGVHVPAFVRGLMLSTIWKIAGVTFPDNLESAGMPRNCMVSLPLNQLHTSNPPYTKASGFKFGGDYYREQEDVFKGGGWLHSRWVKICIDM